ncbi:hypothetical protein A0J61_06728 [Choanephora cucurbitarum]|uniref:Uncharacterized protein n=1 Tax=Choanephora cucurbitarum TaxID=101091 RepID=A0A1C7N7Z4_9FUNG|nr:hypothetical protein A0J61_06728 [Choanephora cucurbitarum]
MFKLTLLYILTLIGLVLALDQRQTWNRRPRQFRMQVFSRPDNRGEVQTLRATNGASTPCWNLASKRVGSYDVNDPMIKVTFYRSTDCKGAPSATFYQDHSFNRNHVMIKAKSVSVTKVKPVLFKKA